MAINLNAPSGRQSPVLVMDSLPSNGSSVDSINPSLTKVVVAGNSVPVQVCEEWQCGYPMLLPRLTNAQLTGNANTAAGIPLTAVTNGMMAFDSANQALALYANGGWITLDTGRIALVLTQANVLAMNGAPIELMAAPGAGLSIFIDKVIAVNNFAVAAFANGGAVTIGYGALAATNALTATIPAAFINSAASATYRLYGTGGATLATASTTNQPIYITNATGAFTNGNAASTIVLNIWYSIIETP